MNARPQHGLRRRLLATVGAVAITAVTVIGSGATPAQAAPAGSTATGPPKGCEIEPGAISVTPESGACTRYLVPFPNNVVYSRTLAQVPAGAIPAIELPRYAVQPDYATHPITKTVYFPMYVQADGTPGDLYFVASPAAKISTAITGLTAVTMRKNTKASRTVTLRATGKPAANVKMTVTVKMPGKAAVTKTAATNSKGQIVVALTAGKATGTGTVTVGFTETLGASGSKVTKPVKVTG